MSEQTKREQLNAKIAALLSHTVENGCTEDEALAFATRARALMDEYGLSMTDIEVKAEPIDDLMIERPTTQQMAAVDYCMNGLEKYCSVDMWFSSDYDRKTGKLRRYARLIGQRQDALFAKHLYEVIATAIESEATTHYYKDAVGKAEWAPLTNREKRVAWASFQVGMAHRVNERLIAMAKAAEPVAQTSNGTALVPLKNAAVAEYRAGLNLHFGKRVAGKSAGDYAAYSRGHAAGDRVNLNRPIGGSTPRGRLH